MSTHHGFIAQFPWIRVDAFDGNPLHTNPYTHSAPLVHLLTHAHTDHFAGLDSRAWDGLVYSTAETKALVLGTQTAADRVRHMLVPECNRKYKFANLRGGDRVNGRRSFGDRLRVIDYDSPIEIDGPNRVKVAVAAIDANHCPGSAMFLISSVSPSPPCAVLVTGDIRAEPSWVNSLRRNPSLAPHIVSHSGKPFSHTLDCVYLDTSGVLRDEELLTKQEAIDYLLDCMKRYSSETKFFFNAWTWGYEDLLLAVYEEFKTKVHLDPYKRALYSSLGLVQFGTSSELTRFHACERRMKCRQCYGDGRGCYEVSEEQLAGHLKGGVGRGRVVYVNPVEIGRGRYEDYRNATDAAFARAEAPDYLMIPFARHSTLPELQSFVDLFRPQTLYPLVISPSGVEFTSLGALFRHQLPSAAPNRIAAEAREFLQTQRKKIGSAQNAPPSSRDVDPEEWSVVGGGWTGNVEGGEEVERLLERWARDVGHAKRKFATGTIEASVPDPSGNWPTSSAPREPRRDATGSIHPSPATHNRRKSLTSALRSAFGGMISAGGKVVPFAEGHRSKRVRVAEEETVSADSFRTVPPTPEQLRRS